MAKKPVIKFTANFERNLEEIERFVTDAEAPQAYDALLDKLLETVVPTDLPPARNRNYPAGNCLC